MGGCTSSKLDDAEVVQLCKDRKDFIKQAIEHRIRFASYHIAYIQSLKKVSAALRDYIDGDEPREFLLDSYTTPSKKMNKIDHGDFISISPPIKKIQSAPNKSYKINYLRSGGNSSVSVEERPPSPEIVRVESYSTDGIFAMQSSPMNSSSFFHYYSPNERTILPPPSPQTQSSSQWDFFWNPFSSLDHYGYPSQSSLDQSVFEDEIYGLRQVREEEGIPELEEETEQEESDDHEFKDSKEEVLVEDVDDDEDDDDHHHDHDDEDGMDSGDETEHEVEGVRPQVGKSMEVSKAQNVAQVSNQEKALENQESNEKTPGFTVYVNRRPTNMAEVIKDLETQFTIICNCANEVSSLLEAKRAQYSSTSNELTAMKMLNPVALIRSASSRSTSSRFLMTASSSGLRDEESSSDDLSEESSSVFTSSHQSTLDKLYAWEKKLYQEVRAGERVRIAYEKKCKQLRNQDVKGVDPFSVDKTRTAIRDLYTQIKVSIHSVEAVSKRIEVLRDEELHPQLLELIHGLSKMWKVVAESHQSQKRTLDDAKLLLAGTTSSKTKKYTIRAPTDPQQLASSAAKLETELRNWRTCFDHWVTSQRSYVHALASWLLRCIRSEPDASKSPFSPRRSMGAPPIFSICVKWSRVFDAVGKVPVLDGLDFFAAGIGSLYAQQLSEDSRRRRNSGAGMEVVDVEEIMMNAEKMADIAVRVLCAGMSVAVSSLTEFAIGSAEGYEELIKQWNPNVL